MISASDRNSVHSRAIGPDIPTHSCDIVAAPTNFILHLVYGATTRRGQDVYCPVVRVTIVKRMVYGYVKTGLMVCRIIATGSLRRRTMAANAYISTILKCFSITNGMLMWKM
jgi:hypothetical protein